MDPKFPLGEVKVSQEAALALALSGQDADFFVEMHATGNWSEGELRRNADALRNCDAVQNEYSTLRGHTIIVFTTADRSVTGVLCPPNSVVEHVGLPDLACWRDQP